MIAVDGALLQSWHLIVFPPSVHCTDSFVDHSRQGNMSSIPLVGVGETDREERERQGKSKTGGGEGK